MHTNDNSSWWNQQIANWLRSIAYQGPELLSHQYMDNLKPFEKLWCKMAKSIDFAFSDGSVIESISQCYNANDKNIFSIFNSADDASEFFIDKKQKYL